ncbi:MAG: diacylglycerol kinase family protein [Deltaproteobacteria bacterium]
MRTKNLGESFYHATVGVIYSFVSQRNMKVHSLAAAVVVIAGIICRLDRMEWGLTILAIFIVLITETMNTAVEKTVDLVTDEFHPLAKKAKNLAAGATLLAALCAVVLGIIVFGPYLMGVLRGYF